MPHQDPLQVFRQRIDTIDNQLLDLLAQRRQIASDIGEYKALHQLPIRHLSREQALMASLVAKGQQLAIPETYLRQLFQQIIDDSVTLQQSKQPPAVNSEQRIAFLGPLGSYSHLAAETFNQQQSLQSVDLQAYATFEQIFQAIEQQHVQYGIVPLENSSSGSINDVYDLLDRTNLSIIAELFVPIHHCLFTAHPVDLAEIKTVYSHPQPFLQCRQFLATHADWQLICCESSAMALAKVAQEKRRDIAAIGSQKGGELYQLHTQATHLADQQQNSTRFIVVSQQASYPPLEAAAKTSLLFSTGQQAGALAEVLLILRHHQLVMSKLISRPISNMPWQERFYVDLKAHLQHHNVQQALTALTPFVNELKVLGCYPYIDYH